MSWERLFDVDFFVTKLVGIIEDYDVKVTSEPLFGKEGWIRKINRHKRETIAGTEVMGVMLEVVENRE